MILFLQYSTALVIGIDIILSNRSRRSLSILRGDIFSCEDTFFRFGLEVPLKCCYGMVSVKQLLKQARAALDAKDYKKAMSLARDVLRADIHNYHAHIFIGVGANALDDPTHALESYEKAIESKPESPLAYKGIIEVLNKREDIPERDLLLARAYVGLGKNSSQHAAESLPRAADLLQRLSANDAALRNECVGILRICKSLDGISRSQSEDFSFRIAHLFAHDLLASEKRPDLSMLETDPLSTILDECEEYMNGPAALKKRASIYDLVSTRAFLRCIADKDFHTNQLFLRNANAFEKLLELAETDIGSALPNQDVIRFAFRDFHITPSAKKSETRRSRYILAAEIFCRSFNLELASAVAGLDFVAETKHGTDKQPLPMTSCTQSVVFSYLHIERQEFKRAIISAKEGLKIAELHDHFSSQRAIFYLLSGLAFCGDRKFKESIRDFEKAKKIGNEQELSWIVKAAHFGITDAAVKGHGRRSRQASTAAEEAAAAPDGIFGILECIWSDALSGDIDLYRMKQMTDRAVNAANASENRHKDVRWEYSLMEPVFIMSPQEIAAKGLTRQAQMIVHENNADESSLRKAQQLHLKAARLFRESADPLAHLGFIFETISNRNNDDRMALRAMRCYERAIDTDAAHPLASRRLVRMMLSRNMNSEAALIARQASETNPTARWAHNVLGWYRLSRGLNGEASVAFRNALRGKPKISARAEEILFGTNVGHTESDNSLIIDVDSWRGMCASYRAEGKIGPALSCLENALSLIKQPPLLYITGTKADLSNIQSSTEMLLMAEQSVILAAQKRPKIACEMSTLLNNKLTPVTTNYNLSEAHIYLAAHEWLQGAYANATELREKAGKLAETAVQNQQKVAPQINLECSLKRVGDTWMEVVTEHPDALAELISSHRIHVALKKALELYTKAMHFAPWKSKERYQDVAAALSRMGTFKKDPTLCRLAVELLVGSDSDPAALAVAFLCYAQVRDDINSGKIAEGVARRVARSPHSKPYEVDLSAAIVSVMDQNNAHQYADSAVDAVRKDPMDWRGWYAVALVRESDARQSKWSKDATHSCEEAYREADRLGAGPAAVRGRVRCFVELLSQEFNPESVTRELYLQACACSATAARAGMPEPEVCRMVIDKYSSVATSSVDAAFEAAGVDRDRDPQSVVHYFPHLGDASALAELQSG